MQSAKVRKQPAIRDYAARQVRQFISVHNVPRQLPESFGAETERPVQIPIRRRGLARMRLIAIDEEHLPGRGRMRRAAIPVLLNASVHQPHDKMFMRMPRKAMFHILRVDNFDEIRSSDLVHANPLRR